ncbi:MAG: hypothetical protein CVT80_08490 [Alphaproteobacteria bacterium HGW-Alphaproteobacteria-2]|nr:MAG: hypothetical protein CVT80_08490 [Alphaproteobacteria bacterium HGW-Alphaproteobacteria-2]
MRNEGPYLLEWLAHHIAAGVSDFLIYSNDCEDGSDAMLGLLHALVSQLGEAEAITLPWRLFGSSGAVRASDAPTTGRFTRAAPQPCAYPVAASFFKTLFRRKSRFHRLGIHRPRQRDPGRHGAALWVDGSGQPLPESFALNEARINLYGLSPATDLVQLNHYSLRSAEEFMVKRARGLPNRGRALDMAYWVERNLGAEEDRSIERMVMQDRAEWQLFGRLLMVPEAQPLAPALARELLALYRGKNG